MWDDKFKTLNDSLSLPNHDLWYLGPVSLNGPNAPNTLKQIKNSILRWSLHLNKVSLDVKWWVEDFEKFAVLP